MGLGQSLGQDARIAVRVLSRNRGTTALCVLSIGLGIGLATGTFSLADAMFLRPLALERPDEVLQITSRGDDGRYMMYGWPDCQDMASAGSNLLELAAYQRRGAMLATGDESEMILAYPVTPNFFSLLGVKAALGRTSLETVAGRPAAVLGSRLWQRRFGGDPAIIGKTVLLNKQAFTVVGVMPPEFGGLTRGVANDVWVSLEAWFSVLGNVDERRDRDGQFEIVARLKPGVSPQRAAAQLDAAIRGPGKHKPAPAGVTGTLVDASFAPGWRATLIGGGGLLVLLGLVLFVACANVAQVRLAQAETRKRDLGIRMALGAGGLRLMRQLVVEAAMVSLAGAALGLWIVRLLMGQAGTFLAAGNVFIDFGLRLDHRVLIFALAATLAAVVVAGLGPARQAVRLNIIDVLKSDQGATGGRGAWHKKALIIGQVAVSVVLFGMAVLFFESLRNAAAVRPGIDPDKKMFVMTVGPGWRWPATRWCEQACDRLSGIPGVRAATFARRLPLSGSGGGLTVRVEIPGQAPLGVGLNNVAGNYFAVMGTRVLAGRGIDANDREGSPLVIVVSRQFARQVFGGRTPLGEWISVQGKMRQVVGVAEDGPSNDIHEAPEPFVYLPYAQMPSDDITLMIETAGEPGSLAQAIRRELKRFDPGVTVDSAITLHEHMQQALLEDRMLATLSMGLGLFAGVLTAAGLFGVIQYAVNRRTREIGLRMALGARPAEIKTMVVAESLRMAGWGIPIGLVLLGCAAWVTRSAVLGVTPLEPSIYLVSAAAAVALAILAAWLPARRATLVDPMAALRSE
jgi:putative ABC transport system permease protein